MTKYALTIPDQKIAGQIVSKAGGSDGQGELMRELSKMPLARSEFGRPRGYDTAHLGRFYGTDYCQWHGRASDGYFHPIGRIMEIVEVKE